MTLGVARAPRNDIFQRSQNIGHLSTPHLKVQAENSCYIEKVLAENILENFAQPHKTANLVIPTQAGIQTSSPWRRGTSYFMTGFRIALRLSGMTALMIFVVVQNSLKARTMQKSLTVCINFIIMHKNQRYYAL